MHISAKADYAMRALLELAREPSRPLTCEAIASSQEIPFRFLKSVVGELRRAGLVRSQRGCEGGYWLGRPAEEITLLDVTRAVDGELITLRGEPLADLAYPGPASGLPDVWREVEAGAAAVLGGVTLTSLLPGGATGATEAAGVAGALA
ncbi:RrF2 family transcriptional regulator [Streptomyces sp. NPDC020707]|uniref:RrF2 family transcriptional regulator n=1 Tax=Streptomyces sp. NPDC020707 TaxID=3365084 RepID=UPI0037B5091D